VASWYGIVIRLPQKTGLIFLYIFKDNLPDKKFQLKWEMRDGAFLKKEALAKRAPRGFKQKKA
ncbi:MAG: hypothetical protein KKD53_01375, partial [Proteobacteria bacterium]|nr:hypothetical protein [Pseudomonadota bacterium]